MRMHRLGATALLGALLAGAALAESKDAWWKEMGLTAEDVGRAAQPWSTRPSLAALGGYWPPRRTTPAGESRQEVAEERASRADAQREPSRPSQ